MTAGSLSQPVAGEVKPHKFRSRTIKSVMSNWADDTDVEMAGKSFPHCVAFMTFLFLSVRKVALFPAKTLWRFVGA